MEKIEAFSGFVILDFGMAFWGYSLERAKHAFSCTASELKMHFLPFLEAWSLAERWMDEVMKGDLE
jgi:hypothetical protein